MNQHVPIIHTITPTPFRDISTGKQIHLLLNFLSSIQPLVRWLKGLLKIGLSKEITEDDLYACSNQQTSEKVARKFELLWWNEMTKEKPSLIKVTLKVYWYRVMIVGFFFAMFEMACK